MDRFSFDLQLFSEAGFNVRSAADDALVIEGEWLVHGTVFIGDGFTLWNSSLVPMRIDGPENAVVQFRDGELKKISGLQSGETVTINVNGMEFEYKAEAIPDSTALKITCTVKDSRYGHTSIKGQTTYTVPDASANILNVVFESNFDWTMANGDGYFLLQSSDWTNHITVCEIKPTATVITEPDAWFNYVSGQSARYLKVSLASDGEISGLAVMKLDSDGRPCVDKSVSLETLGIEALNITAPTDIGLKFDIENIGLPNSVTVNITGAQKGSVINGLRSCYPIDSLQTATLAAGDTITVNGQAYTAGAEGVLKFSNGGRVESGVIRFTEDATIGTVSVVANGDIITVKVMDGEITEISGLENGSVTGFYGGTYTKTGIKFHDAIGIIETLALVEGQTVEFTAGRDDEYDSIYTAGADGAMKFLGGIIRHTARMAPLGIKCRSLSRAR